MRPIMVNTAEYLEQSAKPAHAPAPSHQPQAARPFDGRAAIKQTVAPSRAANSGPSGRTHVPVLMLRTGARFSTIAAHRPAREPKREAVTRYISRVVSAKRAIKGSRTTSGPSLPVRFEAHHASHQAIGGWAKKLRCSLRPAPTM